MPNGAHALAVLAIDRPAKATTIKPDASPAPAEIEQRIIDPDVLQALRSAYGRPVGDIFDNGEDRDKVFRV